MSGDRAGFVYVATGGGYVDEAMLSAASLRQRNPGYPICLVTDHAPPHTALFDDVVVRSDVEHKPVDKLLALECPYERVVFLDTDTHVLDDLSPLFGLLETFDIAALQDVNRGWHYDMPDVPVAFSEFNTGVLVFRRTPAVRDFFAQWKADYVQLNRDAGLVNDQASFRHALFHSHLRIAPLPSEFHFLGNYPNHVFWNARLIHGRGDLAGVARLVNAELGGRAYVPDVGVVSAFRGRRGWLRSTVRTASRMARLLVSPPVSRAAATPQKWWVEEEAAAADRAKVKAR